MITLAGLFSTSPPLLVFESVLLLTKIWYTANPTFARKVVVERGGSGLAKVKFLALPPPSLPQNSYTTFLGIRATGYVQNL